MSGNEILEQIKGHNFGTNERKMWYDNPNVDFVNMNAYIKFGEILSISSQDIERKTKFWHKSRAITLVQMKEK